ncbi:MAG: sulfatase-like hydrolase/transferase [Candidatus Aminicenantes bacterium]|nr:sulfatase-like hydrolase/transferase [Candidatus Aminicenantes bacterium]
MRRRDFIEFLGLGMASFAAARCSRQSQNIITDQKPNILFIMTDDHASHALSCYGSQINKTPHIDRIASGGIRFNNCFCTNSICAPSRATILTGKYSHLNGVRDNRLEFDSAQMTFPKLLRESGFQTAMIGKWHLKSAPSGFDYWNVLPGQGHYYNPDLIEMGQKKRASGYVTDILTDIALDYLENKRNKDQPFLLMLHHKAPHRNWQPALRHLNKYDQTKFPEPETLFDEYASRSRAAQQQEMTLKDHMHLQYDLKMGPPPERMTEQQKAAWEKAYGPKRDAFQKNNPQGKERVRWKYQRYMQDYLGCISSVDENVGRVLDFLDQKGLADNTLVVYTSDQGFYLGDHGWFDKRFMYEESLRMPLLMMLPGQIQANTTDDHLVTNLDFAPTFLELSDVIIPEEMQGISLASLIKSEPVHKWRDAIYYHYYEYPAVHMVKRHYGIRTQRYKLIHFYYDIDAWELYDLKKDPHELHNVIQDPSYSDILVELKSKLNSLQNRYKDSQELAQKFLKLDLKKQ